MGRGCRFEWRALSLLVLLSISPSCSRSTPLNSVPGKVLYKGAPLSGALVAFHAEGRGNMSVSPSTGFTKEDGAFALTTGQDDGAPAGKYVVTIICSVPVKSARPGKTKVQSISMGEEPETHDRLQGAYADRAASRIKVEVKTGPNQLEPFQLK